MRNVNVRSLKRIASPYYRLAKAQKHIDCLQEEITAFVSYTSELRNKLKDTECRLIESLKPAYVYVPNPYLVYSSKPIPGPATLDDIRAEALRIYGRADYGSIPFAIQEDSGQVSVYRSMSDYQSACVDPVLVADSIEDAYQKLVSMIDARF